MRRIGVALAITIGIILGYAFTRQRDADDDDHKVKPHPTLDQTRVAGPRDKPLAIPKAQRTTIDMSETAPPKLVVARKKTVENDPLKLAYNPLDLIHIGNDPVDIFEAEPRAEPWASRMEESLGHAIRSDVGHFSQRAKVRSVECKSASCLITVDAPDEERKQVALALQLVMRGDRMDPGGGDTTPAEGWHRQTLYVGVTPEHRDFDEYSTWQAATRKERLDYLRSHPEAFAPWKLGHVEVPPK